MSNILDKFRSVVVDNDPKKPLALAMKFRKLPEGSQRDHFGGTRLGGHFYLFADEEVVAGRVYECVASLQYGDAIASCYVHHPIFNSVGSLIAAREELVKAIAEQVGLSPGSVGIDDPGRGRTLGLHEVGTGQLIDLLAERMGASVAVTGTHTFDAPKVA